ncbi:MAG: hypothetical protein ACI8SJ_001180 [Shewanella sp.]|jgi:hypothetical protein
MKLIQKVAAKYQQFTHMIMHIGVSQWDVE